MAELLMIFDNRALNEEAEDRVLDLTLLQSSEAIGLLDELSLDEPERFMRAPTLDATAFGDGDDDEPVEFDDADDTWFEAGDGLDWARSLREGAVSGAGVMNAQTRNALIATIDEMIAILNLADEAGASFHLASDE